VNLEPVLQRIESADLDGLREEWRRRYGVPPRLRSKTLLRHLLAWRIQAETFGGLDEETRRLLRDERPRREPLVARGSVITREWRGVTHQIEAADDGFLYDGRRWKSLSEIARVITGTRWNGPRFFGLREAQP
jgi:hypothetical protein